MCYNVLQCATCQTHKVHTVDLGQSTARWQLPAPLDSRGLCLKWEILSGAPVRSAWPVALPRSPTTAVLVWGVGTAEIGIANGIVTMVGIDNTSSLSSQVFLVIDEVSGAGESSAGANVSPLCRVCLDLDLCLHR